MSDLSDTKIRVIKADEVIWDEAMTDPEEADPPGEECTPPSRWTRSSASGSGGATCSGATSSGRTTRSRSSSRVRSR